MNLDDIIEKTVVVIIEVMMTLLVAIDHHVVHHPRIFPLHRKLCLPITVNYHQQILLKFLRRISTVRRVNLHRIPLHPQPIRSIPVHPLHRRVDHVEKIPNVRLHVMVIIRNHRNVRDVIVMMNVAIVDVPKTNRVAVKNRRIQQKFLLMLKNNQTNKKLFLNKNVFFSHVNVSLSLVRSFSFLLLSMDRFSEEFREEEEDDDDEIHQRTH